MADLWQYFEPLKEDPFYLTCTICALKFKGWKRSTLEEHLKTKHNLKMLPKISDLLNNFPKSATKRCHKQMSDLIKWKINFGLWSGLDCEKDLSRI